MNLEFSLSRAIALAALVTLGACGGGGGGGGGPYYPVANTPPPAATPSASDTFIAYVKSLVESSLDAAEPADVTAYDPAPVSDFAEPIAVQ